VRAYHSFFSNSFFLSCFIGGGAALLTSLIGRKMRFFSYIIRSITELLFNIITFFPLYPLLLIVFSGFSPNLIVFESVIALLLTPPLYRLFYSHLTNIQLEDYISYQVILGQKRVRIYQNTILPDLFYILKPTLGQLFIQVLLIESVVGYIGIGLPDTYSGWGTQVNLENIRMGFIAASILPAAAIISTALSIQILCSKSESYSFAPAVGWSKR